MPPPPPHAPDLKRAATRLGKPAFEAAVAQGEQLALEEAIEPALGLED